MNYASSATTNLSNGDWAGLALRYDHSTGDWSSFIYSGGTLSSVYSVNWSSSDNIVDVSCGANSDWVNALGCFRYVREWSAALSTAEITAEFEMTPSSSTPAARTSNLRLSWPLANATDTTDWSGNGNTPTIVGAATSSEEPPIGGGPKPGVGSLIVTGYAPTASASDHILIVPGVGTIVLDGYAPTVNSGANASITPGAGSATITGYAPDVQGSAHATIVPGAGAATITGYTPDVQSGAHVAKTPDAAAATITGYAPGVSISSSMTITPGTGALTFAGSEPDQELGVEPPAAGSLVLTGYAPTVASPIYQTPGVGALAFTGYAPSVSISQSRTIAPGVASLSLTGYAPSVGVSQLHAIAPGAGSLSISGHAPTITIQVYDDLSVTPEVGALTLTGYAPGVTRDQLSPDPFTFTDLYYQPQSTVVTSAAITVTGITASVAISVTGGLYSINGGSFVSVSGTVSAGDTVRARHTTAAAVSTTTDTVVTIGGISDTFSSTTAPPEPPAAASTGDRAVVRGFVIRGLN